VVPVLFGRKGKVLKCFNAGAHAAGNGWVLEVEAGRAVDNSQFLKDIFQACMMHDVLHLAIAVRNTYRGSDDFAKVESFLETLYSSGRLQQRIESSARNLERDAVYGPVVGEALYQVAQFQNWAV
jgi:hypothetical protein